MDKKLVKSPATKTKAVNKSDMKTGNVAGKDKSNAKADKSSASKKEINVGSASVHSPPRASRTGAKSKSVGTSKSARVHGAKVLSKKVITGKSKGVNGKGDKNVKNKDVSVKCDINKSKKVIKQVSRNKQKANDKNVRKSDDISESDILLQDNKTKDGKQLEEKQDGSSSRGSLQASNAGLKQSQEESAKKILTLSTKSSKLVTGTTEKKADMAGECKDAKKIESEKKTSTRAVAKPSKQQSKSIPKKGSNIKTKKTQIPMKVSKKIFSSKPQKRALTNDDRRIKKGEEKNKSIDDSGSEKVCMKSNESSHEIKSDPMPVKAENKPKKGSTEVKDLEKANVTESDKKVKKRKLDKKTLAKRKLSRMKKLGFLNAPPRRSAALNASAIMNCMLDKSAFPRPIKIKVEQPDSDDETTNTQITDTKQEKSDNEHPENILSGEKSLKSNKLPQKLIGSSQNKINEERLLSKSPSNLSSVKNHKESEDKISKQDLKDQEKKQQKSEGKKKKQNKLKKKIKDKKNKIRSKSDSGDVVIGRRMASLNASAMMHASYGREEKRERRDPLRIAIEASLRDVKEREERELRERMEANGITSSKDTSSPDLSFDSSSEEIKFDSTSEDIKSSSNNASEDINDTKEKILDSKPVNKFSKLNLQALKTETNEEKVKVWQEKCQIGENIKQQQIGTEMNLNSLQVQSVMEGLSESDIKTKLIESAKIKSKIARQSSEEKVRKKMKKTHHERSDDKIYKNKLKSLPKDKKHKSSCDTHEDQLPKRRKSHISQEDLSDKEPDEASVPNEHNLLDSKDRMELDLLPDVAKSSKFERAAIKRQTEKVDTLINNENDTKASLAEPGLSVPGIPDNHATQTQLGHERKTNITTKDVPPRINVQPKVDTSSTIVSSYRATISSTSVANFPSSKATSSDIRLQPYTPSLVPPTAHSASHPSYPGSISQYQTPPSVYSSQSQNQGFFEQGGQVFKTVPVISSTTPTATVQPTLLSIQNTAKPVVGTVSPVRPVEPHNFAQPPGLYQSYPSVYGASYIQAVPSPGAAQFYASPTPAPAHQPQYVQSPYPSFPYTQNYSYQAFQPHKQPNTPDQPQAMFSTSPGGSFPQGYYIAAPAGAVPYPQAIVPVTSSSAEKTMIAGYTASTQIAGNQPFSIVAPKSSGGTQTNSASPAQGFIYGPYSYPYGAGRVIGPIIALAPGNVPVASVATPILNIPTATSSEQQRSHNPVTLGSETMSVTTNQTRTTVNVVQSNQQMVKAVIRPSTSNTSVDRSENYGMPILTRETKPQGKAVPMISTNTHSGDSLPFRQILPKNLKSKPQPALSLSSSYGGNMRPMQIVGPIAANNPMGTAQLGSGLVAAVLPTPVQSVAAMPSLISTTSSSQFKSSTSSSGINSATTISQILRDSRENKKASFPNNNSDRPAQVIINRVVAPVSNENVLKNVLDSKNSQSGSKMENSDSRLKESQMKNNFLNSVNSTKPAPIKVNKIQEVANSNAQFAQNNFDIAKRMRDFSPDITVKIKSKSYNSEPNLIRKPKDWKEVVKAQNIIPKSQSVFPKPKSSLVTPLRVPKPHFQFFEKDPQKLSHNKLNWKSSSDSKEMPTFHIPHKSDKSVSSEPRVSLGHPGLPFGLQRITSSLIHNSKSPTKMALKEMRKIPPKILAKPMSILTPLNFSNDNEMSDEPPKLSPQISVKSLKQSGAEDFIKSADQSKDSQRSGEFESSSIAPNLGRSRLQLKPATSPKLTIEKYLTVSNGANVRSLSASLSDQSIKLKEGPVNESRLSDLSGERKGHSLPGASPKYQHSVDKKPKRDSSSRKHSQQKPILIPWSKRSSEAPKKSGGWTWKGEGFVAKVHLNNEELPVERICYNTMRHEEGDEEVSVKDCILLASGNRKKDLPYIAKVNSLWENPEDGEMMMSLIWFYRPEHTDIGRQEEDCPDEVFASKHRDHTSVACIEDKCFVMTFNEYCRYMRFSQMVDECVVPPWNIVPERKDGYPRAPLLPSCQVANDRVFLCRKVYDTRGRRMLKNPY